MKITVIKKAVVNAKPSGNCPYLVDTGGGPVIVR
jgi:hypothetical protein